ncbi:hypothetical protein NLU13_7179 [Sarocladium strictum]|uniref:AA1-like domain-containing protein n=1 Tax=Sarocladium strictum TaxID=5046 RepID=A0AA39GCV3_SARSR|nr:hypothetical protein NLU13_7179 [Sarocladium strictum]
MVSFIATILLAGSALALPNPIGSPQMPNCVAIGENFKGWTIEDFDFHSSMTYPTPSHLDGNGYLSFALANPGTEYRAQCVGSAHRPMDFFYSGDVWNCQIPGMPNGDHATFSFDRASGMLTIDQTWACPDSGAKFTASGAVKLDLDCEESSYQNPKWEEGQIYSSHSTYCKPVTVQAPGSLQ